MKFSILYHLTFLSLTVDTLPLNGRPIIDTSSRRATWRGQLFGTVLRRNRGVGFHIFSQKLRPRRYTVSCNIPAYMRQ